MLIEINSLPEGRQVVLNESESIEGLDITGIKPCSPLEIRAKVTKIADFVDINISLKAKILVECSLCLSEKEEIVTKDFRLDFNIEKEQKTIDITEDIRQELMLDYPLKPLCSLSCKGLCLKCGKNLNEGQCGCK